MGASNKHDLTWSRHVNWAVFGMVERSSVVSDASSTNICADSVALWMVIAVLSKDSVHSMLLRERAEARLKTTVPSIS